MEFNQLIIADDGTITEQQKAFKNLHTQIITTGNMVANSMIQFAENLKQMKESKLYIEAGFETFGEYTETACNIKERHACNYIRIVNELSKDYLQSNAQLGVAKLILLTGLTADEREELTEQVDIKDTSTRELKAEIVKLKAEKKEAEDKLQLKIEEFDNLTVETEKAEEINIDEIVKEKVDAELQHIKEDTLQKLHKKDKEIKDIEKKLETAKANDKSNELIAKYKAEIKELQKDNEFINAEAEKAKKQLITNSNPIITEFKYKFAELQSIANAMFSLIAKMDSADANKCRKATKTIVSGWAL